MHEVGMEKQVGYELIEMEVVGHKEVQASNVGKVDTAQLQNYGGKECYQVNDEQILCNRWYAEHHIFYCLNVFILAKTPFIIFWRQNY